jgi:putative methyltransferase, YaeB/AF_0241 family
MKHLNATYGTIVLSSLIAISAFKFHKKKIKDVTEKLTNLRDAERRGRIKAEIQLRTALKSSDREQTTASSSGGGERHLTLRRIGTITSPFTKRMGTPRQGALAPHARGFVELDISVAPIETLSGIENYSHAWIIFSFHANTDIQSLSVKTKVKPPRGGGIKVGSMATRSPHRPNNIGLSLVKITGIDHKRKRLHIAALDLVNGTPVYDIKPVVPWDIPGYFDQDQLRVPTWVSQDDALPNISFTQEVEDQLEILIQRNLLSPLYQDTDKEDAKLAIMEVLAQDPRAAKKRGTFGEESDTYNITFGRLQLHFIVLEKGDVEVVGLSEWNLDEATFVDGIPLKFSV